MGFVFAEPGPANSQSQLIKTYVTGIKSTYHCVGEFIYSWQTRQAESKTKYLCAFTGRQTQWNISNSPLPQPWLFATLPFSRHDARPHCGLHIRHRSMHLGEGRPLVEHLRTHNIQDNCF